MEAQKANDPLVRAVGGATTTKHSSNHNADKTLATIRAKLCLAGGQTLHATEGGFFVTSPFGHVNKFDSVQALQAYADKVGV